MPLCFTVTPEQLKAADFGQHYSHDKESARPGYYQVLLQESGVNVELSATTRTGIHRYTFPEGQPRTQGEDENCLGPGSLGTAGTSTLARGVNPSPRT